MCDFGYKRKVYLRKHLKYYQTSVLVCDHCNKNHLKDHICDQNIKKLHTANDEIKNPLNLFSTKVFKCSEGNNLNIWIFSFSLKIKVENE